MALPPGIPNLLGNVVGLFLQPADLLTGDTFFGYGAGVDPQWGLFLNGSPVVVADTVTSFGYKQSWSIADYPVERGGFESYDKVNTPFHVNIQFVAGGSPARREALLNSIAAIGDELTLYDVLTPEATYIGVNVEGYEYRRTSQNGLGLMIVDVDVLEIREEGVTDFKNTKSPSGYAADSAGNVQSPVQDPGIVEQLAQAGVG
jgi:hypothetical protein